MSLKCFKTEVCMNKIKQTVVHEAAVAEPDAEHHGVLSSGTVSLGNQINDAHSQSDTRPLFYTFSSKARTAAQLPRCRQHEATEKTFRGKWSYRGHVYLQQQPVDKFARRDHGLKGFEVMISVSVE